MSGWSNVVSCFALPRVLRNVQKFLALVYSSSRTSILSFWCGDKWFLLLEGSPQRLQVLELGLKNAAASFPLSSQTFFHICISWEILVFCGWSHLGWSMRVSQKRLAPLPNRYYFFYPNPGFFIFEPQFGHEIWLCFVPQFMQK